MYVYEKPIQNSRSGQGFRLFRELLVGSEGVAPDAVKAARPVLNGEDEETGRKALRLVLTQHR
jgi:hypothetical protein